MDIISHQIYSILGLGMFHDLQPTTMAAYAPPQGLLLGWRRRSLSHVMELYLVWLLYSPTVGIYRDLGIYIYIEYIFRVFMYR